jgi:glycosyltransferase involved in cell wall biosynthesis
LDCAHKDVLMATPDVSLIVTTYQMPQHLERVLAAAARQTVASRMELIVSDDGSTDETPDVVARFAAQAPFPVKFVSLPHDGFQLARTRNEGVRHARGKHLVFLDGDLLIEPDHVEQHLRSWRPHHVTNTYCVRLEQAASEKITCESVRSGSYLQDIPRAELRKLWIMQLKAWWYRAIGHGVKPVLRGGNMGILKADYERLNGYDERFQGWGQEDDDLSLRMRRLGMRVDYILHRTRTYHLWHPPAASKPKTYKDGANIAYLRRRIRLTRCLAGLAARTAADVTIRPLGRAADHGDALRWMRGIGCQLVCDAAPHVDVELALASDPRFSSWCDCRVLFVDACPGNLAASCRRADIVLSPDGLLGGDQQVRLPFSETASFFAALGFADPLSALKRHPQPAPLRHAA